MYILRKFAITFNLHFLILFLSGYKFINLVVTKPLGGILRERETIFSFQAKVTHRF